MTNRVLEPKYSIRLYRCSYLFLINVIYAYYSNLYVLIFLYTGGLVTSLNYWRYPRYDYNRLFDMFWIISGTMYHYTYCNLIQTNIYYILYHFVVIIGLLCYGGSCYYTKKNQNMCSIYHMGSHIFGHIAHFILYTGLNQLCL